MRYSRFSSDGIATSKRVERALAGAREMKRLRRRRHLPAGRNLQRQRAFGFPFTIVEDLDGHAGLRCVTGFALSLSNGDAPTFAGVSVTAIAGTTASTRVSYP